MHGQLSKVRYNRNGLLNGKNQSSIDSSRLLEANARAVRMQNQTTQQLQQRVKDLKYWSNEIDR